MNKIILLSENEKDFSTRGLGVLKDIVNPIISETINGIYDMSFFYPLNGKLFDEIKAGRIVFAKGPKNYQAFRIKSIEKDDSLSGITVHALHISYDLADNFIEDTFIQNKGGDGAIKQLLEKTAIPHNFKGSSDIQGPFSSRIVRENVLAALLGTSENSFLNRAGGQFERDNFNINWLKSVGSDRGVKIKYKKNLVGLKFKEDYRDIITRVMPQGFDNLFLPEKYIDSPLITEYPTISIRKIKFDDIKSKALNKDEKDAMNHEDAINLLRLRAQEFLKKSDRPKVTADVNFVDLSQTLQYVKYKQLESVYIGDTVTIIHGPLDLNFKKQVTSYRYDPIEDRYIFITLGEDTNMISNSINSGTIALSKVEDLKKELDTSILEKYKNFATDLINSGFGGFVKYHKDRMLIMDTDNEETATKVWQFNKNGIGYSKTGIQGPYSYAWTIDGTFNTDFIGANSITANKLASDVGQSLDLSSNVSINTKVSDSIHSIQVGGNNLAKHSDNFYNSVDEDGQSYWATAADITKKKIADCVDVSYCENCNDWLGYETVEFSNFNWEKIELEQTDNLFSYDFSKHIEYMFNSELKINQDYMISFDVVNLNNFNLVFKKYLSKSETDSYFTVVLKPNEYRRIYFKLNSDDNILYFDLEEGAERPERIKIACKKLKIEEGTVGTAWSPNIDEIGVSKEEYHSEIKQLKDSITSVVDHKVDKNEMLESLGILQRKLEETQTKVEQTSDNWNVTVSKVTEIENKINKKNLYTKNETLKGNDLKFILSENVKTNTLYTIAVDVKTTEKDKLIFIYNAKNRNSTTKTLKNGTMVWTCEFERESNYVNLYPLGSETEVSNFRIYEGAYKAEFFDPEKLVTKDEVVTSINASSEGVKIKGNKIDITGDLIVNALNGSSTKISGDKIQSGTIIGSTLQGTTIKLGNHGYLRPVQQGLQINAPANMDAIYGVGLQVRGLKEGLAPKGLYIYNNSDFTKSGNTVETSSDILLTVAGRADIANRYNGNIIQGSPIISNFYKGNPVSGLYQISFIGLASNGRDIYFNDGTSTGDLWVQVDSTASDKRLKENIVSSNFNSLDFIKRLQFYSFDWKANRFGYRKPHTNCGLVADELQELDSSLVYENGKEGTKNIDEFRLLNLAVKAIQELTERVEQLEEKLQEK